MWGGHARKVKVGELLPEKRSRIRGDARRFARAAHPCYHERTQMSGESGIQPGEARMNLKEYFGAQHGIDTLSTAGAGQG